MDVRIKILAGGEYMVFDNTSGNVIATFVKHADAVEYVNFLKSKK